MLLSSAEGWPLGLQPLNSRVAVIRNRELDKSLSFNTLLTVSPATSSNSSPGVDSESTGSFFRGKSFTLGSLIGISGTVELSRRPTRSRIIERIRVKKTTYRSKSWLFSLCSRLSTDAMRTSNTPSLGHFLQAEREAACNYKRNVMPRLHEAGDFALSMSTAFAKSLNAECSAPPANFLAESERLINE